MLPCEIYAAMVQCTIPNLGNYCSAQIAAGGPELVNGGGLKMLIGLESARGFLMSIFDGTGHLGCN